jgi:XRE family transcriptional regulator, aerobic/anaerobic benzoate catabolism transcriptional regulator
MLLGVGRLVRAHRLAQFMSQQELAAKARVNVKHLSALECGGENCTLVTLAHIAEALDCTLADIISHEPTEHRVVLTARELRRVREAVQVLDAATTPR